MFFSPVKQAGGEGVIALWRLDGYIVHWLETPTAVQYFGVHPTCFLPDFLVTYEISTIQEWSSGTVEFWTTSSSALSIVGYISASRYKERVTFLFIFLVKSRSVRRFLSGASKILAWCILYVILLRCNDNDVFHWCIRVYVKFLFVGAEADELSRMTPGDLWMCILMPVHLCFVIRLLSVPISVGCCLSTLGSLSFLRCRLCTLDCQCCTAASVLRKLCSTRQSIFVCQDDCQASAAGCLSPSQWTFYGIQRGFTGPQVPVWFTESLGSVDSCNSRPGLAPASSDQYLERLYDPSSSYFPISRESHWQKYLIAGHFDLIIFVCGC